MARSHGRRPWGPRRRAPHGLGAVAAALGVQWRLAPVFGADEPAERRCSRFMRLPLILNEINEGDSECPEGAFFLRDVKDDHLQKVATHRRLRETQARGVPGGREADLRNASAASASQVASASPPPLRRLEAKGERRDLPKDCRHEVGVQLNFRRLLRRDFAGTGVIAGKEYWARLIRARPDAISPTRSSGKLHSVSLRIPGVHKVGHQRFDGEVHFKFLGSHRFFWDGGPTPDFNVIVPLEASWSWEEKESPIFDWVARAHGSGDGPSCDWSFQGVMTWIRLGFRCAEHELHDYDLMPTGSHALLYRGGEDCVDTFMLAKAIGVPGRQLRQIKDFLVPTHRQEGEVYIRPDEIYMASALRVFEAFSVFSASEMQKRIARFETMFWSGLLMMLCAFVATKKFSNTYELEVTEFVMDQWVQRSLCIDHWLCYLCALVVPWVSYFLGSTNINAGMTYEYKFAWFCVIMLHLGHELVMCVQVGGAIKRLSYFKLIRGVFMTMVGLVHYELFICFSIVAMMHGSNFGVVSMVTFAVCNIGGQVVLLTLRSPPSMSFNTRSFHVLDMIFHDRVSELNQISSHDNAAKLKLLTRARDDEGMLDDTGVEAAVNCLSSAGDLMQFCYMVFYIIWFGQTPVVSASLCLCLFYLFLGVVRSNQPWLIDETEE